MDPVPVGTPASPPVKQLLTLGLSDVSSDTSPVAAAKPLKQDFESPSYREALATALRWDPKRQEPYLQLPSYPELRLTPFRNGIEDEIVSLVSSSCFISGVGGRVQGLLEPGEARGSMAFTTEGQCRDTATWQEVGLCSEHYTPLFMLVSGWNFTAPGIYPLVSVSCHQYVPVGNGDIITRPRRCSLRCTICDPAIVETGIIS
jgi:hypothetical protein